VTSLGSWDRVARFYDLQLWLERAALGVALDMAQIGAEDSLLDIGSGTGGLLRELAKRGAAPREAIGIDLSPKMLARAPALPAGWRLARGDAAQLRLPDRSFDVVTATYLLHLLGPGQRAAVLTEARRVLRRDGRLVAVTVAPPRSEALARILDRAFGRARSGTGILAGLRPLDPRPDLERAGFAVQGARRSYRGYPSLVVAATLGG
jgi:ubiquinone/menaquinone biosynthesis C-methylase UbiE